MSRYLDILVGIVLLSLLVTTILLPIDYMNTTISDLGLFLNTPILHGALALSIFLGGAVVMIWRGIRTKTYTWIIYISLLALFGITGLTIFEWLGFWLLCSWTITRLIKND